LSIHEASDTRQGATILKISTHPACHGYGKKINPKYALQVLKFQLVLHAKTLVRAL